MSSMASKYRVYRHGSPQAHSRRVAGNEYAKEIGAQDTGCVCVTCDAHKKEARNTFEKVATVIGIYKLASHWYNAVIRDRRATPEHKMEVSQDLEDAKAMLRDLTTHIEQLSPASRQQLLIFSEEMKAQVITAKLEEEDDDELHSDPPSPEEHPSSLAHHHDDSDSESD